MLCKILSAIRVARQTRTTVILRDGVAVTEHQNIPANYYFLDSATATRNLRTQLNRNSAGRTVTFTTNANTGVVTATSNIGGAGQSITISYIECPHIYEALRLPGTGAPLYRLEFTNAVRTLVGSRCHMGGFYPSSGIQADIEAVRPLATQYIPDDGNPQTLFVASRTEYALSLRAIGYSRPAASGHTEYHEMLDWYRFAIGGSVTRYHPDRAINLPYSAAQRRGFVAMQIVPEDIDMMPENEGWYRNWLLSVRGIQYRET